MQEFETGFDYGAVCRPTPSAAVVGRGNTAMTARGGRQRSGRGVRVRKRERRRCKSGAPKVHGLPRFAAFCKVEPRKYAANRTPQITARSSTWRSVSRRKGSVSSS